MSRLKIFKLFLLVMTLFILSIFGGCNSSNTTKNLQNNEQINNNVDVEVSTPINNNNQNVESNEVIEEIISNDSNESSTVQTEPMLKVYFFDVGQGDSIYIKTLAGDDILIDAGDSSRGADVVKYLKELNVEDIEVLIATNPNDDHIGGFASVLDNFLIKAVYAKIEGQNLESYEDFLSNVKAKGIEINDAKAGEEIPLEGVKAVFVGPVKGDYEGINNNSVVIHFSYGETSFLFASDAEALEEQDIINEGYNLKADVLKVGNHGSLSSTSAVFLQAVKPSYSVVSVGSTSDGYPDQETLRKLFYAESEVSMTAYQGTVIFSSDGENIYTDGTLDMDEMVSFTDAKYYDPDWLKNRLPYIDIVEVDLLEELVTIKNNSDEEVNMEYYFIRSAIGDEIYNFPVNFILKPGESVQVSSGENAIDNPPLILKGWDFEVWDDNGDIAELWNYKGALIHKYEISK